MLQISFERNGDKDCTKVFAKINTGLPIDLSVLSFEFECAHQYAAALLETYLNVELNKAIETAHKNGYEQGWKAAKMKAKKADCFGSTFERRGEQIAW